MGVERLEVGEHTGTHLDAPIHWISGRDGADVSQIPPRSLVAPAVVIDRSAEAAEDPDYLLGVEDVRAFEAEHGPLPEVVRKLAERQREACEQLQTEIERGLSESNVCVPIHEGFLRNPTNVGRIRLDEKG